jgi:uncharacterized protein YjbI with pentapeptide repeats
VLGWLACSLVAAQDNIPAVLNQGFAPPQLLTRESVEKQAASGESLRGRDFGGALLAGVALRDVDLTDTHWAKTDLRGARFTNCTLDGADFSGAYLGGAAYEGCSLKEALFVGASLRGSYFSTCDLTGASFDGADIAGTSLIDITLSPTGAPYLPALRTAIELRGGAALSPALLAASSGDAFTFTYNRNARGAWAGSPMTFNPLLLALDTLGFDATYDTTLKEPGPAQKALTSVLRRGLVAILPVRLAGAGLDGNAVEGPVWVVACEMTVAGEGDEEVHVATPFGPMALDLDDLLRRWRGPWPTLVPAGEAVSTARFPLCTVGAMKAEVTPQAAALEALRHASTILKEPRVFEGTSGGFQAYEALIGDASGEQAATADLAPWSAGARLSLAASRRLAAEFLREVGPKMPETAQPALLEAADLYEEVGRLLTEEWPPSTDARSDVLKAALDRERRAVALLDHLVAEAAPVANP